MAVFSTTQFADRNAPFLSAENRDGFSESDDWAEAELYEIYQNQTGQRQEVVYYFSLPESAVITGLWLGNSPDRNARFSYRVSPRGAAQALYRNEVNYNRDPALVEELIDRGEGFGITARGGYRGIPGTTGP